MSETLPFNYELIFSARRRSVQLAIVQGQLKIRAPTGTSAEFLQQLLIQKQDWVLKHLQTSKVTIKPSWVNRTQILISGELLAFSWILATKGQVIVNEQGVQVQVPMRVDIARRDRYIEQQIQHYLTNLAEVFFQKQVQQQAALMAVTPTAVRIGSWRRRWGCCDSRGVVGFNWRLLQAPDWVARYVVIHELSHLRYMNHSAAFWQFVKTYYPEYLAAQRWLKTHQSQLF
ncbi:M48 family metallopeptidase [Alishewanella longhuensis]|nr:SprT family zinc-dependent metalloprotease [Alishewanella longhuensis]